MTEQLSVRSRSYADEAAYRTTEDLAAACAHMDWRLVGGVAVHLHQRLQAVEDVPDRPTQDADAAIRVGVSPSRSREDVASDLHQLVDELVRRDYHQREGNRFVRRGDDEHRERVIDLLVPGYRSRIQHNRPVPGTPLRVDAVPGLGYALGPDEPHTVLDLTVEHLDSTTSRFTVPVASVRSLLVVKALAWHGRSSTRDALDIWRLLEVAHSRGPDRPDWPADGGAGDAHDVLTAEAEAICRAATTDWRSRARIRALLGTHVRRST